MTSKNAPSCSSHDHEALQKVKYKKRKEIHYPSVQGTVCAFDSGNAILKILSADLLDVVVPPAAASPPRPRVAPSAAVTASPDHLLPDDHISLMPVQEEREDEGDEEEKGIHDAEHPRRLEHRAVLVDVYRPRRIAADTIVAKRSKANVDGRSGEVCAVG